MCGGGGGGEIRGRVDCEREGRRKGGRERGGEEASRKRR